MADMTLRAALVDDEPLARERLRSLLAMHGDVRIVAECGSGTSAVEAIRRLSPEIVFLDIRMPEMDGFGVLDELEPLRGFDLIFLTAHEDHALRAFETRAVDYLLKPVSRTRLAEALDRVRERRGGGLGQMRRLVVRDGAQVTFVPVAEVDWIESAGNYAVLHAGSRTHILRETMGALESFLRDDGFLRVSRGGIINLARVTELRVMDSRVFAVLGDGTRIAVKRPLREVEARLREGKTVSSPAERFE